MLADANGQTTEEINQQNQQAGDSIAADKLGRAVHGSKKIRLLGQLGAPGFGGFLVNHPGIEVSIN